MSNRPISTNERAFHLARAGTCHSVAEIREQLLAERYEGVHGHLSGTSTQKQLKAALAARGVSSSSREADKVDA